MSVGERFKWNTITETCSLIIVDGKNENKLKNDVERMSINKSPVYNHFLIIVLAKTPSTFGYYSKKNRTSRD